MVQREFVKHDNNDINGQLIKKIRVDNLQKISADCDLQICLAFKFGKHKKIPHPPHPPSQQHEQPIQSTQDQVKMLYITNFNVSRRQQLLLIFKQIQNKWMAIEGSGINKNQGLNHYLFQDNCDLSYILYEINKMQDEEFRKLNAEDLLFLQFLCLQGKKRLNDTIIKYYQQNISMMIDILRSSISRIKYKIQHINDIKIYQIQKIDESDLLNIRENEKTKKIKKDKKNKITHKIKYNSCQQKYGQNDCQNNNYNDQQQLAIKTCNYIIWAYWYVVDKP